MPPMATCRFVAMVAAVGWGLEQGVEGVGVEGSGRGISVLKLRGSWCLFGFRLGV